MPHSATRSDRLNAHDKLQAADAASSPATTTGSGCFWNPRAVGPFALRPPAGTRTIGIPGTSEGV
jgi:hypothetical protein